MGPRVLFVLFPRDTSIRASTKVCVNNAHEIHDQNVLISAVTMPWLCWFLCFTSKTRHKDLEPEDWLSLANPAAKSEHKVSEKAVLVLRQK